MSQKLMKTREASVMVRKDSYLSSPGFLRKFAWSLMAILFLGGAFLGGCGGRSSQQAIAARALTPQQAPDSHKNVQDQLKVQPIQTSPATYKDYKVGTEDQLVISIYGQEKLNREMRINGQGEITMPMVGVVKVAGMTTQEIEKHLMELYDARFLVNPQVTVEIKEFRHQRVAVTGAVVKPGSYEIIGPRTLLEVLSLAGGFSNVPNAQTGQAGDVVNVISHQNAPGLANLKLGAARPFAPKTNTTVIDLHRLVNGQEPELNITVRNGDVVHVPFAGTAYVLGGVKKPGNIPVRENLTVSQAVTMAGGIDPILGTNQITVMRFDGQGKPISINTNLTSIIARKDPDIPVKDNDVVVVNQNSLKKAIYVIRTLLPIPSGGYSLGAL